MFPAPKNRQCFELFKRIYCIPTSLCSDQQLVRTKINLNICIVYCENFNTTIISIFLLISYFYFDDIGGTKCLEYSHKGDCCYRALTICLTLGFGSVGNWGFEFVLLVDSMASELYHPFLHPQCAFCAGTMPSFVFREFSRLCTGGNGGGFLSLMKDGNMLQMGEPVATLNRRLMATSAFDK